MRKSYLLAIGLSSIFFTSCLVKLKTIKPGKVGVKQNFGKLKDKSLSSGLKLYFIGTKMYSIDTRVMKLSVSQKARTKDGVELNPSIKTLLHINPDKAPDLIKKYYKRGIGYNITPQHYSYIIESAIGDAVAKVISGANSFEEANLDRDALSEKVLKELKANFSDDIFVFDQVLVTTIGMNKEVLTEINKRSQLNQQLTNVDLEIQLQNKQIELARIKGEKEAAINKTIQPTLTPEIIEIKKIEAQGKVGERSNSIIISEGIK